MGDYYQIAFGPITLWASEVEGDGSRTLVVHELASGDDHPVSDRGKGPRPTHVSLLFDEFPEEGDPPLERFRAFQAKVDSDNNEDMFVHPILGAYLAKVGAFTYKVDEDSNITDVSCEFVPTQAIRAVLQPGLGRIPAVGVDAVQARADELNALLESTDLDADLLESGIPLDFITTAATLPDSWLTDEDITARDILVDVAHVTDQLATFTALLEGDLELFDTYQAAIMFGAAFRAAAQGATSETANVFFLRVGVPTSVLGLVARVYGGADADLRERQVRSLNDLRTPGGLIPYATELVMPAVTNREDF